MELQYYGKMFCNFLQKVLAKNTLGLLLCHLQASLIIFSSESNSGFQPNTLFAFSDDAINVAGSPEPSFFHFCWNWMTSYFPCRLDYLFHRVAIAISKVKPKLP
jgi:hypothetical protein